MLLAFEGHMEEHWGRHCKIYKVVIVIDGQLESQTPLNPLVPPCLQQTANIWMVHGQLMLDLGLDMLYLRVVQGQRLDSNLNLETFSSDARITSDFPSNFPCQSEKLLSSCSCQPRHHRTSQCPAHLVP